MRAKRTPLMALGLLILVGVVLLGCGGDLQSILGLGGGFLLHTPKFLIALDDTTSPDNVNVFSVNPMTGVLTPVSGSPFTTGLSDGSGAVTHPFHGDWVYVADWSGNVQALKIGSNGTPTVTSTDNTGYDDFGWVSAGLTVSSDGKFLYTTTNGPDIVVWTIDQTTGALTQVGPYTTPLNQTYGVVASGGFVYITDTDSSNRQVHVASIGTNGQLTSVQTVTVPVPSGIDGFELWTSQVDKTGRFLFVGDENRTITTYTIGSNGQLTLANAVTRTGPSGLGDGDMDTMSVTPDNKFLVATTDRVGTDVFTINQSTGALTAVGSAPFGTEDSYGTVLVDPSGKFVYVSDDFSDIVSYTIDPTTGALTPIPGSPFATNDSSAGGWAISW